jgi:hypothetical protein
VVVPASVACRLEWSSTQGVMHIIRMAHVCVIVMYTLFACVPCRLDVTEGPPACFLSFRFIRDGRLGALVVL